MNRDSQSPPPLPPPPPSFPVAAPFVWQRSTDHTQSASGGNSTYFQADPLAGNNYSAPSELFIHCALTVYVVHSAEPRGSLVLSPSTSSSSQPGQPPPLPISTRPHSNVTAPTPTRVPSQAYPTSPAPPYEYEPPRPPHMLGSATHHPSISDPGPSIPVRDPFTAPGNNATGPRSLTPQRLMTMPIPDFNSTAASGSYHPGPGTLHTSPQSATSGGSPPSTGGWSYRGCSTLV